MFASQSADSLLSSCLWHCHCCSIIFILRIQYLTIKNRKLDKFALYIFLWDWRFSTYFPGTGANKESPIVYVAVDIFGFEWLPINQSLLRFYLKTENDLISSTNHFWSSTIHSFLTSLGLAMIQKKELTSTLPPSSSDSWRFSSFPFHSLYLF